MIQPLIQDTDLSHGFVGAVARRLRGSLALGSSGLTPAIGAAPTADHPDHHHPKAGGFVDVPPLPRRVLFSKSSLIS